jgi:hypothetical protein
VINWAILFAVEKRAIRVRCWKTKAKQSNNSNSRMDWMDRMDWMNRMDLMNRMECSISLKKK